MTKKEKTGCNCPWEKDPKYECERVTIVTVDPDGNKPTRYCKTCLIAAIESGDLPRKGFKVVPGKKLPAGLTGPHDHNWRKVNLVTRDDGTDLVRCTKCGTEVVCNGFFRPGLSGCLFPGSK